MGESNQKDLKTVEILLTEAVKILYESSEAIEATQNPLLIETYQAALELAWSSLGQVRVCNHERDICFCPWRA
jgi:hypothetical protein